MGVNVKNIKNFGKRKMALVLLILIAILLLILIFIPRITGGESDVEFTILDEEQIPQEIRTEVIPEYRDFERALACMVEGKVYVIVTRGEKPTSGFTVSIDSIMLWKDSKGDSVLSVYADFDDPKPGDTLSQILTYPLTVAETNLTELPDRIELKAQYMD